MKPWRECPQCGRQAFIVVEDKQDVTLVCQVLNCSTCGRMRLVIEPMLCLTCRLRCTLSTIILSK
jgi:hypothetical protein